MQPSGNLELSTIAALAGERAPHHVSQADVIFREGDVETSSTVMFLDTSDCVEVKIALK